MNDQTQTQDERSTSGQSRSTVGLAQERYEMARTYERLWECPEEQAEAIGRHYAAHAKIAMELLKLIELRRYATDTTNANADAAIAYLVEQIKRNHRHDLGMALEWVNV